MKKTKKLYILLFVVILLLPRYIISSGDDNVCNDLFKCFTFNLNKKKTLKFPDTVFIVIDPGHGGKSTDKPRVVNVGTDNKSNKSFNKKTKKWIVDPNQKSEPDSDGKAERVNEKDVVLVYAKKLRKLLQDWGYKNIKMTREKEKTQQAWKKAQIAHDYILDNFNLYSKKCNYNSCNSCDPFLSMFVTIHIDGAFPKWDSSGNKIKSSVYGPMQKYSFDRGVGLPAKIKPEIEEVMPTNRSEDQRIVCSPGLWVFRGRTVTEDSVTKTYKGIKQLKTEWIPSIRVPHSLIELGNFKVNRDFYPIWGSCGSYKTSDSKTAEKYPCRMTEIVEAIANAMVNKLISDYVDKGFSSFSLCKEPDNNDDNYSYYSGSKDEYEINMFSEILLPFEFFNKDTLRMINGVYEPPAIYVKETSSDMYKDHHIMIIPSGSLMIEQNNKKFKQTLKQYVSQGGTIIVFSQQYGSHIENIVPVPEGEKLKVYGWRQDQSCYWGSVYTDLTHPVLSSLRSDKATLAVDGYIDKYPKNSVILLRRTKNRKPAMLYYKYGKGYVVLTTLYTDWAYAHSQATTSELNIIRDLLTFSKGADSDIPMYNLSTNPKPTVSLSLRMKNDTNYQATKAKIKVLTLEFFAFHESKEFGGFDMNKEFNKKIKYRRLIC